MCTVKYLHFSLQQSLLRSQETMYLDTSNSPEDHVTNAVHHMASLLIRLQTSAKQFDQCVALDLI